MEPFVNIDVKGNALVDAARRLLAAAPDPRSITRTGKGFRAPLSVAIDAGLVENPSAGGRKRPAPAQALAEPAAAPAPPVDAPEAQESPQAVPAGDTSDAFSFDELVSTAIPRIEERIEAGEWDVHAVVELENTRGDEARKGVLGLLPAEDPE